MTKSTEQLKTQLMEMFDRLPNSTNDIYREEISREFLSYALSKMENMVREEVIEKIDKKSVTFKWEKPKDKNYYKALDDILESLKKEEHETT